MPSTVRVRSLVWFATGAALSILATVMVVQTWRADAAASEDETTFVPITPCRLFDYRPGAGVSQRSTPIGPAETATQQITGAVGACTIPPDATGVALNVTITQPTAASNLRIFPAGVPVPNASNLNWTAGQGDTPNKVDVRLSPTGAIGIYNDFGSVYVLADATGYYTHAGLADLQQQLTGLQGIVAAQGGQIATLQSQVSTLTASRPFAVSSGGAQTVAYTGVNATVAARSVTLTAPTAGTVTFNASLWVVQTPGDFVGCAIKPNTSVLYQDDEDIQRTTGGVNAALSMTRAITVTTGQQVTYYLVCTKLSSGSVTIKQGSLTAIFTPAP